MQISLRGGYHISNEIFPVQIIVTSRLSPEENLYLHCLTDRLQDSALVNRLTDDYSVHQEQEIYRNYMQQLSNANTKSKGENTMAVCEGILNLCGTSTEEIETRTTQKVTNFYLPKIEALTAENQQLASHINYLKGLLNQNNIPFDLKP